MPKKRPLEVKKGYSKKPRDDDWSESEFQPEPQLQEIFANEFLDQCQRKYLKDFRFAAYHYIPGVDYSSSHPLLLGLMSIECKHCKALKWGKEPPGLCCASGKVSLPDITPPTELTCLTNPDLTSPSQVQDSKHFLSNSRKYNNAFQMTSFGASTVVNNQGGYMPTFKVQGQVYHRAGSLLPVQGDPKFLQIYFMGDPQLELRQRSKFFDQTKELILWSLQDMLHNHHPLVESFKTALEQMPSDVMRVVIHADRTPIKG